MANEIITLILAIFIILVIGGLIGWAIAKLKFKSMLKKLDKKINLPEEKLRLEKLKNEQIVSSNIRGVIQNEDRKSVV